MNTIVYKFEIPGLGTIEKSINLSETILQQPAPLMVETVIDIISLIDLAAIEIEDWQKAIFRSKVMELNRIVEL